MPWVHGDDYMKQTNAELKHLLLLRRLPHSGNKTKMASRLMVHDEHHPFPFQKLPGELRNEIYKYAATWQDLVFTRGRNLPIKGHTEGPACFDGFESVMVHSSLFRASKQTRAEGLALFYRLHCFVLFVQHGGCFLAILLWLQNIGDIGRRNIRHLHIRFREKCCKHDKVYMDRIHEKLSDQATVVYIPEVVESLWKLGQHYYIKNPAKAPLFRVDGINPEGTICADLKYPHYNFKPDFRSLSLHDSWLEYSMVFYPGESWFGPNVGRHT